MRLDPACFDNWFRALAGCDPFPWQRRLFRQWLCPDDTTQARWPQWLQLPTASGKTAIIDLAVLALAAGSPCARRRIAFVVDRRLVVDEAARRARLIAQRLRQAYDCPTDVLYPVARALVALGGSEPLLVAALRGGIPTDDRWARSATQATVLLSTVDQVGSRLLFRSYGDVGPRGWPIHAGLLGCDTVIIVDEAHCSRPFCQTLQLIRDKWQHFADERVGLPLETVFLSATLGQQPDFELDAEDAQYSELQRRLQASKPIVLIEANGNASDGRAPLVEAIRSYGEKTLAVMRAGVLGIVVNRVRDARRLHEALPLPADRKLLLQGRSRPWERDRLLEHWLPRLQAGAVDRPKEPVAVVATQAIEVGANLDFDFLITEVAPLDALRQRFGRLDRLGDRAARIPDIAPRELPCGAVVAAPGQIELKNNRVKNPDPLYGEALCWTWHWLIGQAAGKPPRVDFGVKQLETRLPHGEELQKLCQPAREAYRLLPAHLDILVQTAPPPEPDVEISAFLHGTVDAGAAVTLVWRADLPEERPEVWLERVAVQPPGAAEGCNLPIGEFRRWIGGGPLAGDVCDTDLETPAQVGEPAGDRLLVRWRGASESEIIPADRARPGDVLVAPSTYGGCDEFGWNPDSRTPVLDIGDAVAFTAGRRPVLRLAALDPHLGQAESAESARSLVEELRRWAAGEEEGERLDGGVLLQQLADTAGLPEWLQQLAARLATDRWRRIVEAGGSFAMIGSKSGGEDLSTAAETSLASRNVSLVDHCRGVRSWTERLVGSIPLPRSLASDLSLAAWLHDVGKADPRFQTWLHGGDAISASLASELLAKSAFAVRDPRTLARARRLAGYPDDARHELLSLALIASAPGLRKQASDWDLVMHLVAAHHGFARPFFPAPVDAEPVQVELEHGDWRLVAPSNRDLLRLDSGVAERFWTLVRRYGWWGLAYLEAILRLADHRRSEEEEARED